MPLFTALYNVTCPTSISPKHNTPPLSPGNNGKKIREEEVRRKMSSSNSNHYCYAIPSLSSTPTSLQDNNGQRQQPQHLMYSDYWDHNSAAASLAVATSSHQYLGVPTPYAEYPQPQVPLLPQSSSFPLYLEQQHGVSLVKCEEPVGRIGLNLGYRTYFSSGDAAAIDRLFRRSRGLFPSTHPVPRCQAEGCKADLSGAKHYHRRHKVCEFHSKATVVIAGGLQQRFCQQCSRFHVLSEFDEAKRSCRKRLADHNRRRRKPQPATNAPSAENNEENNESTEMVESKGTTSSGSAQNTAVSGVGGTMMGTSSGRRRSMEMEGQNKVSQLRMGPALLSLGAGGPLLVQSSHGESESSHQHYNHNQQLNFASSSTSSFYTPRQSPSTFNDGASQIGQGLFELDFM